MSNRVLARVLQAVDAIAVMAVVVVAAKVIPGAEAAGAVPQGSVPAFIVGCIPLAFLACTAWRLFSAIGRGETFVSANAALLKRMGVASAASAAVWLACIVLCAALSGTPVRFSTYAALSVALVFTVSLCVICLALALLTDRAADIKSENDMTV